MAAKRQFVSDLELQETVKIAKKNEQLDVIQAVISLDSSLQFEALFKHSVTVRLLN